MPEGEPNTDGAGSGGESGSAQTGISKADKDKWFGVGQQMENAKDQGKSY